MGSNAGRPPARRPQLSGRLVQLAGDRDAARFSCEVSRVCAAHPTDGRSEYGEVLAWVVDAIVDVIIARLGPAGRGERFILDLRFIDGGYADVDDLPESGRWVLRTVSALLGGDLANEVRSLTAAEQQFDITMRAETLADALIWLDFLLDVDLPDPPDVITT
ncbi:hypothetical protein CJ179_33185 [Rhodococcus sp. ACS1]|uniref:hypothetical protein n=1 Tax=Rhodococcus TaxID=1827 RepID=UPI000BB16343|nr:MULTISPECIES: hypothetical protein [Rhodococcus]PBC39989.1 hypothetical protein CJ179_33185 [Rhodococcus sp. ACS1]QSE77775.1 hypothetical protein JWS14_00565 [Rhodococcus koreensis]